MVGDVSQKNINKYKVIFASNPIAMLILDDQTLVTDVNDVALSLLGVKKENVLNKKFSDAINCLDCTTVAPDCGFCLRYQCTLLMAVDLALLSGESSPNMECNCKNIYGDHFKGFSASVTPIIQGSKCHLIVVLADITDKIKDQIALESTMKALQENESKFRLIFHNANDSIFLYEMDEVEMRPGNFIEVNNTACEIFGYSREELLQLSPWDLNSPESRADLLDNYQEFFRSGQSRWVRETTLLSKNGVEMPFQVNANYFLLNGKKVVLSICRDVSQWKLAKKSQNEYRALFMNMHCGFNYSRLIFNELGEPIDFEYIEVNEAYAKMYNLNREEILGKKYSEVFPHQYHLEEMKETFVFFSEIVLTDTPKVIPEFYSSWIRKWFVIGLFSIEPGTFVSLTTDITLQKHAEIDLKKAKEEAEAANRAKSEFLANMSHEIRTPLHGILGMIDLTLLTELNDDQQENLKTAKICGNSLLRIINDILFLSKIDDGKLVIEEINFDIKEILEDIIRTHSPKALQKGLEINYTLSSAIPKIINGDPERLKQVLNNLMENAIKFTAHGQVLLSVNKTAMNHDEVELSFSVIDSGIGISEGEQVKLFKYFSQVDSSITRKYGGTGLGLTISKKIVEMMGGKLQVMSQKDCGSIFYFCLKFGLNLSLSINQEIKSKHQSFPSVMKSLKPQNILVVEDDTVNLNVVAQFLKANGHIVDCAANGLEALVCHEQNHYDIVLMDIQMPHMDGIEVMHRIREREGLSMHTPIIALTAHALQEDRERFLSLGMDGYLSKPINMNDLFQTIDRVIMKGQTI